jgi:hypothetical protein
MAITAILRLPNADNKTAKSSNIYRYAVKCDTPAERALLDTALDKVRTVNGNLWVFDPTSLDPQIQDRTRRDIAAGCILPKGTITILSNLQIPHERFQDWSSACTILQTDSGYSISLEEHPIDAEQRAAMQDTILAMRERGAVGGLSQDDINARIGDLLFADIAVPKLVVKKRTFVPMTIDFSATPFTDSAPETPESETPIFGTPAEDTESGE